MPTVPKYVIACRKDGAVHRLSDEARTLESMKHSWRVFLHKADTLGYDIFLYKIRNSQIPTWKQNEELFKEICEKVEQPLWRKS